MNFREHFKETLFQTTEAGFEEKALALFDYQFHQNQVYRQYVTALGIQPAQIRTLSDIPFLPVEFFKTHRVISGKKIPELIFESSGTGGIQTSKHYVADPEWYKHVSVQLFEHFFGPLKGTHLLALLPSYKERAGSSLVYMTDHFMHTAGTDSSGYYLYNHQELADRLKWLISAGEKVHLIGVTFALIDFALAFEIELNGVTIIETGGMKGRKKEMIREEVHALLCNRFHLSKIASEYGMTELLSQAYSLSEGIFHFPLCMKALLRETDDPFNLRTDITRGGINLIDLANIDSCAFIETKDIGLKISTNTYKIIGRFDNSDLRGCNLMVV